MIDYVPGITSSDIADLVEKYSDGKTARVVRFLRLAGYTIGEAHGLLERAVRSGHVELTPGSCSAGEAWLCPRDGKNGVLGGIRSLQR